MNIKIKHKRVKNKILNTFTRFSLSAFVVASFFYTAPILINFANKNFNNKEFTNNSKNILNKTLNKDKTFEENDELVQSNEVDLLYDILEENNSEINLVRYTTSEINALFKEVKYNLKEVRDTKLVKPIDIGLLPNEIKKIGNTKGLIFISAPVASGNSGGPVINKYGELRGVVTGGMDKNYLKKKYEDKGAHIGNSTFSLMISGNLVKLWLDDINVDTHAVALNASQKEPEIIGKIAERFIAKIECYER